MAPSPQHGSHIGPRKRMCRSKASVTQDLAQLSIGTLIAQFADALAAALASRDVRQLDRWAGWTVMAATLTELWSRLLLPADPAESRAAVAEAEALRRQLLARARMRQAADWLERRSQLGRDVFPRGMPEASVSGRGSDLADLLRACLVALQVPETQAAAYRPRPPPLWRVSDAIPHLRQRLADLPDGSPLAAFLPTIAGDDPGKGLRCRAAVASTLVAGLELARDGALALEQDATWMPIRVRQRDNHAAIAADG
jgi:segregation and condensation protein A